jgi:transposase
LRRRRAFACGRVHEADGDVITELAKGSRQHPGALLLSLGGSLPCSFPSAAEFTSLVGTCPGKDESAEENHSSRSEKGNKYLRGLLSQAAHAVVKKNGSHFQAVFRRLLPRLGYQSAIWAIAHRSSTA